MAVRNFLPRCLAFFNRIPTESLKICHLNAMHLGKKFLATIFSVILYAECSRKFPLETVLRHVNKQKIVTFLTFHHYTTIPPPQFVQHSRAHSLISAFAKETFTVFAAFVTIYALKTIGCRFGFKDYWVLLLLEQSCFLFSRILFSDYV